MSKHRGKREPPEARVEADFEDNFEEDLDAQDARLFRQAMRDLEVMPRRGPGEAASAASKAPARAAPVPAAQEDFLAHEDRLFLDEVAQLSFIPDKDRTAAAPPSLHPRRLKVPKTLSADPQASLDLHGLTVPQARRALRPFLQQGVATGLRLVLVVTGKGLNSPEGQGVLHREVEGWIRRWAGSEVRAYSEAPRALGGRGAFLLHLRTREEVP